MTAREREPEPVEQYLSALRARLRVRDAGLVLAEAEDHLREDVAAGLAAGLTELEAQHAAISSFGSVRAVVRAHEPRWRRAAARLRRPALLISAAAGLFLTTVSVAGLASFTLFGLILRPVPMPLSVSLVLTVISHDAVSCAVGLALLYASRLVRRTGLARTGLASTELASEGLGRVS